jgi:hypothetical protein
MMLSGDKRASLSSNLLDGKDGGASDRSAHQPQQAANGAAKGDPKLRDTVLYNKGAASASGFRPQHWSYDAQPADQAATVTPFPASAASRATPAREPTGANSRARLAMIGLGAFSTVALIASGSLFLLSRTHDGSVAAVPTSSTIVTAAPAPTAVTPAPAPTVATPPLAPPLAAAEEPTPAAETSVDSRRQSEPAPPKEKPIIAAAPAPAPLAPAEIEELVSRGGQLLATGDIAAARVFFERAAEQGNAAAATAAGKTYDPLYLEEAHVRGIRGDPVAAAKWYRRASAAGDKEADLRMQKLIARYAG